MPSVMVLGTLDGRTQMSWERQNCFVQFPQRSMGWIMETSLHRHLQYCWYAVAEATSDQRTSFVGRFMVTTGTVVGSGCDFGAILSERIWWVYGCGDWVDSLEHWYTSVNISSIYVVDLVSIVLSCRVSLLSTEVQDSSLCRESQK